MLEWDEANPGLQTSHGGGERGQGTAVPKESSFILSVGTINFLNPHGNGH